MRLVVDAEYYVSVGHDGEISVELPSQTRPIPA